MEPEWQDTSVLMVMHIYFPTKMKLNFMDEVFFFSFSKYRDFMEGLFWFGFFK